MHNKQADREVRLPLRSEMTPRLLTAASFVRSGATVADVGTDHAYLPIYLVSAGIANCAIASDINEGPLARAEANVRKYGLSDRIALRLTPGLSGIEAYAPTDILICGMGGELIASILEATEFVRDASIRLILQPMSSAKELRLWLASNGFEIIEERFATEKEKLYVVLCAQYIGVSNELSEVDGYVGFGAEDPLFGEWIRRQIAAIEKQVNGLSKAGREDPQLNELLGQLKKRLAIQERNST